MERLILIRGSSLRVSKLPHWLREKKKERSAVYKRSKCAIINLIPFSAFWLRSSVVSVLISLISDMWANGSHDIKLIFKGRELDTVACYRGSQASPLPGTTARAWRTLPIQLKFLTLFFVLFILFMNEHLVWTPSASVTVVQHFV